MRTVRVRPDIEDQESLSGYLHRVSEINHYHSISIIASEIKMTVPHLNNNSFTPSQLTSISNLTGKPTEILQLHSNHHFERSIGKDLTYKLVLKNRVKYCPLCIRETLIHKLSWTILPLNICHEHKTFLVENCFECDSPVSLNSLMSGSCEKCRSDFVQVEPEYIGLNDLILQQQMYLFCSFFDPSDSRTPFNLKNHDFLKLVELSYYILQGMKSYLGDNLTISSFHNKRNGNRNSYNQSHAFNNAFWMYQNFPHNFYRVFNDFIQQKQFATMYEQKRQFERIFEIDLFTEISEAYKIFWLEKINLGVVRRDFSVFKKSPELLDQRKYVRKDEIRISLGMSYEKITQLSEHKEINMLVSRKGNKTQYLVDKISYTNALEEKKYLISKKEAALMLGIQKDSVSKLITAGFLKTYKRRSNRYELLSHKEVKQLFDDCRGKLVTDGKISGVRLHEALITYSVNGLSIIKIVQFTQEGLLNPLAEILDGTLAQNFYRLDELQKCSEIIKMELQNKKGYYLTEVIKLLKIGEKKAWKLIETGLLVPEHVITLRDGRKRYLFNKKMIDNLLKNQNPSITA